MNTIERIEMLKTVPSTSKLLEAELLEAEEEQLSAEQVKERIFALSERMLQECSLFQGYTK